MAIETERRVFLSCERLSVHLSLQIIFERFNYTSVTAANYGNCVTRHFRVRTVDFFLKKIKSK